MTQTTLLKCACGQAHLEVEKAPILSAECYCNSCRAAGAKLQSLSGASPFLNPNGGTHFVLYRKDRVRFPKGAELLKEFRLTPASKTRRVVATCCNTPVFLDFKGAHWLSLYACLWPQDKRPAVELRTMTSDLPDASVLPDDVPNGKRQTLSFFAKVLGAWIAMGFRIPKVTAGNAEMRV